MLPIYLVLVHEQKELERNETWKPYKHRKCSKHHNRIFPIIWCCVIYLEQNHRFHRLIAFQLHLQKIC